MGGGDDRATRTHARTRVAREHADVSLRTRDSCHESCSSNTLLCKISSFPSFNKHQITHCQPKKHSFVHTRDHRRYGADTHTCTNTVAHARASVYIYLCPRARVSRARLRSRNSVTVQRAAQRSSVSRSLFLADSPLASLLFSSVPSLSFHRPTG